jgi:hypothetical protein
LSHSAFTGITRKHLGRLIEELAGPWRARRESELAELRGGERRRAAGAGRKPDLPFVDQVLVTLAQLRWQLSHKALGVMYGVHRCTISRAIGRIRPLIARRGFAAVCGPRLHTLADVFAYAAAHGITLRLDGTEIQVRRPRKDRPGRRAFVSGKKKQNTIKTTIVSDAGGRTLWAGAHRPGRMHDQSAVRTEGIDDLLDQFPTVWAQGDNGYRGLRNDHPTGSASRRRNRPRTPPRR